MTTLTFTGNNYSEIMTQVVLYMQQIGAQIMPLQAPAELAPVQITPVVPTATPLMAPQTAPPPVVPTTTPDYTHEQIGRAVAAWIDKAPDNRKKALDLLSAQGCQSVTQLDTPAKRGTFTVALRAQGVQI
jgi:hypothetical protein